MLTHLASCVNDEVELHSTRKEDNKQIICIGKLISVGPHAIIIDTQIHYFEDEDSIINEIYSADKNYEIIYSNNNQKSKAR